MSDYDTNPFIVIWEVTRACALHCLHCRAEAQIHRDPRELTTEEGKDLLRQIQEMDSPLFVFTGGDPLMREDLFELASYGKSIGLRVSITPSATPRVTADAMRKAADIGLDRWAFSLDGSTADIHDRFRGTSGSYDLTMRSLRQLRKLGMPLQINTTVCVHNKNDLRHIADMIGGMGVVMWSVFFLVPTGRGKEGDMLSAEETEEVLHWLADLADRVPYAIKTTAAPFYRRVLAQRAKAAGGSAADKMIGVPAWASAAGRAGTGFRGHPGAPVSPAEAKASKGAMRAPRGVTDGNGFVFISHIGDVSPSGFLPLNCGNVREETLADIYRTHPVFTGIRTPDLYKGKCGVCDFRHLCGGSRARAYAVTGDPLGSDPACAYVPDGRNPSHKNLT